MFRRCSSDESELSDSVINSKSAIRISVCLQRYFKDVRSRCYILVIRNRRVRWLEKRLQKIFSLPGGFCLCANGHLLPSSEPLALLRAEDSVEVIPRAEECLEMLQKRDSLDLNVNNQSEKEAQNGDTVSESPHTLCGINHFASISNHSQTASQGANNNRPLKTTNGVAGTSKLESNDDIDGVTASNDAQESVNTTLPTNNNNSFTGENKGNDTAITFHQLKRRALALLDAHRSARDAAEAAEDEPPPRRVRRRVRRRTRRNPPPEREKPQQEMEPEPEQEPEPESEPEPEPERRLEPVPERRLEPVPESQSSPSDSEAGAVWRNGAARPRPPRVVRPLGADE
ncbi:E3 ubiquitin-protein ligase RNF12-B-like [Vanessa cardui]|uniref:E3 ubiquitin-protein ligase RNF12-B-like n=1 Tax=Vanessa cardui TaxID=171605 RepID=UPI001F140CAE|nr:E3 ubiquitin-protein ligase RNF12-B-like [Vanessa cardui]